LLKKQSQFTRSACCVLRSADTKLKKQSQFASRTVGVSYYLKGYYGKITTTGAHKNKAKQSQFAGLRPEILSTKL
jgi:hypothetical protein